MFIVIIQQLQHLFGHVFLLLVVRVPPDQEEVAAVRWRSRSPSPVVRQLMRFVTTPPPRSFAAN